MNLERTCASFFYYFVYLKVNLDLEWINQLGESSPNFIFAVVNLDPIVSEKRWTDGEYWPNDFVGKVNRGEDLRWVGSRCPLMHALIPYDPTFDFVCVFASFPVVLLYILNWDTWNTWVKVRSGNLEVVQIFLYFLEMKSFVLLKCFWHPKIWIIRRKPCILWNK